VVRSDRNLAWYLLATALISAASMATSFYTVDAARSLRLSDAAAGIYAIVLLAASTIGNLLWGYVGDHLGHKRVVEGGVLCTGLAAGLAILVRNPGWGVEGYAVVFALVGLGTSGISLAALTFIVDFAPVEQRPTYIGLATVAGAPFAFLAPLAGGVVADHAGYPAVFALTGLLALAAALIVLRRVVDPRIQRAINVDAVG
jgi:MFS family permease